MSLCLNVKYTLVIARLTVAHIGIKDKSLIIIKPYYHIYTCESSKLQIPIGSHFLELIQVDWAVNPQFLGWHSTMLTLMLTIKF